MFWQQLFIFLYIILIAVGSVIGFPTYRGDNNLSTYAEVSVPDKLYSKWTFYPIKAPKTAWSMPSEELPKSHQDNAFYAICENGIVYFSSSITGKVYAIDLESGKIIWTYNTSGSVRYSPVFYNNRIYTGSDDGYVYCLNAKTGDLVWKFRAAPDDSKIIGNGSMISVWPVRTSVSVYGGKVYFAAGIWPFEGIYIYSIDADTGSVIWRNGTAGDHSHTHDFGGMSPQGYIAVTDKAVIIPSGRAWPAIFDRKTGQLRHYKSPEKKQGGTWTVVDGDKMISGVDMYSFPRKLAYRIDSGGKIRNFGKGWEYTDLAVVGDNYYMINWKSAYSVNKVHLNTPGNNDKINWRYSKDGFISILATKDSVILGANDNIEILDIKNGEKKNSIPVSGTVVGLCAVNNYLIASAVEGPVYCFGNKKSDNPVKIGPGVAINSNFLTDPETKKNAARIINTAKKKKGYCLILDAGNGNIALELARETGLKIICLEKDKNNIIQARNKFEKAGLLGHRIVIEDWDIEDLPEYFADLILTDGALKEVENDKILAQVSNLLCPWGGTALFPKSGNAKVDFDVFVRGGLKHSGDWTGLYANAANTACSEDENLKGPFGVLWYGEPGPQGVVERHGRAMAPLVKNGKMFFQGENFVSCYNLYNSALLWRRDIQGAVRVRVDVDGGNLFLNNDSIFVAVLDKCLRLDQLTGETLKKYKIPVSNKDSLKRWGFLAVDDNILYGTVSEKLNDSYASERTYQLTKKTKSFNLDTDLELLYPGLRDSKYMSMQRRSSFWTYMHEYPEWGVSKEKPDNTKTQNTMSGDTLFALDINTGEKLWEYYGKAIPHIAISIDESRIYFTDTSDSRGKSIAVQETGSYIRKGLYESDNIVSAIPIEKKDIRNAIALDKKTGKVYWKRPADFSGCGGDKLGSAVKDGLVFFFGYYSNHDKGLYFKNKLLWRRITALNSEDGKLVWSKPLNYLRRPLIVGDKIIIEPKMCDLKTGEIIQREHPVSGKKVPWEFYRPGHSCSVTAASAHTIFYRSYSLAIYDLVMDKGINLFGAIRPGCWLNTIPANGVMVMPEASSGCICAFPIKTTVALVSKKKKDTGNWTVFVSSGENTPVKRLSLNLGSPGDMRDKDGNLWLAYPRPVSKDQKRKLYGIKLDITELEAQNTRYFYLDYEYNDKMNVDDPWLYSSGCLGNNQYKIPVRGEFDKPGLYTIHMGFFDTTVNEKGKRVFDILIQGKTVSANFDINENSSGEVIIKEFKNIQVKDNLIIELKQISSGEQPDNQPLINYIDIISQDL